MNIKNLNIRNISSFEDFSFDSDLNKTSLLFGTNGSGKSTLASLLQLIDRTKTSHLKQEADRELHEYIARRVSRESTASEACVEIQFNNGSEVIKYTPEQNKLTSTDERWTPIRVFNDKYTERTIGDTVDVDLPESGIVIGEPNKKLEESQKQLNGLVKKQENFKKKIEASVEKETDSYRTVANSNADVSNTLSFEHFIKENCDFLRDDTLIDQRKKLGYTTPQDNIQPVSARDLSVILQTDTFSSLFKQPIHKPDLDTSKEKLLLNFTEFYTLGVEAYNADSGSCPFCFQEWKDADSAIQAYKRFLASDYNQKRDLIKSLQGCVAQAKEEIVRVNHAIESLQAVVREEGKKYSVDTSGFTQIPLPSDLESKINDSLNDKLHKMTDQIEMNALLTQFADYHTAMLKKVNKPIHEIKNAISSISTKRRRVNVKISEHLMRKLWEEESSVREEYIKT